MHESAGEILETEHYLPLPDRFEIHEYQIMERFCLSVDDEDMRDDLCDAIRGRGAFRRFKDRMQVYGMAEEGYRYRDAALREIAMVDEFSHLEPMVRFDPDKRASARQMYKLLYETSPQSDGDEVGLCSSAR